MKVKIHDTKTGKKYIAKDAKECKDDIDKSAFEAALAIGATISMGKTIAEYIY